MSIQTAITTIRNPFAGRRAHLTWRAGSADAERAARREHTSRGHALGELQSLRAQSAVTLSLR